MAKIKIKRGFELEMTNFGLQKKLIISLEPANFPFLPRLPLILWKNVGFLPKVTAFIRSMETVFGSVY